MSFQPSIGYAGDVSVIDADAALERDWSAISADMRTTAIWAHVGAPNVMNDAEAALRASDVATTYFLSRPSARSRMATVMAARFADKRQRAMDGRKACGSP